MTTLKGQAFSGGEAFSVGFGLDNPILKSEMRACKLRCPLISAGGS
jgi:hypothetical protein